MNLTLDCRLCNTPITSRASARLIWMPQQEGPLTIDAAGAAHDICAARRLRGVHYFDVHADDVDDDEMLRILRDYEDWKEIALVQFKSDAGMLAKMHKSGVNP